MHKSMSWQSLPIVASVALALAAAGCGAEAVSGGQYMGPVPNTGSALIDDGSTGAVSAVSQHSNLFDESADHSRPTWKVAGVDYAVGVPPGLALKDPVVDGLPAGAVLDVAAKLVRVNASGVVLEGYDWSRGGFGIAIGAVSGVRVTRCQFGHLAAGVVVQAGVGSSDLYFGYNDVDGSVGSDASVGAPAPALLELRGGSVVEYNWIRSSPGTVVSVDGGGSLLVRNNLLEDVAKASGASGSFLAFGGGAFTAPRIAFNTIIQRPGPATPTPRQELLQMHLTAPGTLLDAEVAYNTILSLGSQGAPSSAMVFHFGADAAYPWSVTGWAHDNFVDPSGALTIGPPALSGFVYLRNIDAKTGAPLLVP